MIFPMLIGGTIYDMAQQVFGSGLAESLSEWMNTVLTAMQNALALDWVTEVIDIFSIVGCSFMIVYFFADLMNQASKDMFSFEKMIIAFIRMIVAFAVLLFLPDILQGLPDWALSFKEVILPTGNTADLSAGTTDLSTIWGSADGLEKYHSYFDHFNKVIEAMGIIFSLLIPYVIAFFADLMGKFIITSTGIMLVVRALFAPLGVVQIFEEGTRSSGVRYLKSLLAEGMSFACIIAIIMVANSISGELTASVLSSFDISKLNINPDKLQEAAQFQNFVILIIPKLVIAGGMASGSKIAHDVMGA